MHQIFNNIFFCKGYNRTLIYDSLKAEIYFIPNFYYDFLYSNNFIFDKNEIEDNFFTYLVDKEMIFESNDDIKNYFPKMNDDSEIPYDIITMVIELSEINAYNLYKLNLTKTNGSIPHFNFIFSNFTSLETINLFAEFVETNEADTFEITLLDGFCFSDELFKSIEFVKKIIIVNNFSNIKITDPSVNKNRFYKEIDNINLKLSVNLLTYFESDKKHVYFNKKMFIGKNSEIKNSFETNEIFGYLDKIIEPNVKSIINQSRFQYFWDAKKEETLICNVCEFRRLCVDNRIPVNIKGRWLHKKECDYNPYISKWENEEDFLSLSECGVKQNIKKAEIIINIDKLNKTNSIIWEDA
jgi:hypothetical protein